MKTSNIGVLLIVVFGFFSCKQTDDCKLESINIDFTQSKRIDINDRTKIQEIPLEVTDRSLLTHIEQVRIKNNEIFIYDAHRVIVFDMKGRFLHQVGHKGQGPGEYTNINSFFFAEDKISLFDNDIGALFNYDEKNVFVSSSKTEERMASIYPIGDGRYIGKKSYQGDALQVASLAVLDSDLRLLFNIDNRNLQSGIGVFDYCCAYDNNVLYWEFLNDTIYTLKSKSIVPRFYVDFGEYKIPLQHQKNKTIPEILEYIGTVESDIAIGVRYIHEDLANIRFIFTFDAGIYYVRYNKQTKSTSLCNFYDPAGYQELEYFMSYNEGKIMLSIPCMDDSEGNPKLLLIDEAEVFKYE